MHYTQLKVVAPESVEKYKGPVRRVSRAKANLKLAVPVKSNITQPCVIAPPEEPKGCRPRMPLRSMSHLMKMSYQRLRSLKGNSLLTRSPSLIGSTGLLSIALKSWRSNTMR